MKTNIRDPYETDIEINNKTELEEQNEAPLHHEIKQICFSTR